MFSIFEAMFFKFTIAYLKHKLTANNRHGTHSPFVYKLADEVIYDFSAKKVYKAIEEQRKKLFNDDILFANRAKSKMRNTRLDQLLFRLAAFHTAKNSLIIGSELSLTTAYLAKANPESQVIVIEESANKVAFSIRVCEELELKNVELQVGNYNSLLPKVIAEGKVLDLVYLNGSYTKEAILNYFNWCLPKLKEHSLLIIDDIYKNGDVKAAWAEIKNHPQVTVTIDLFWLGLVYFKKGQAKEHFKLKF